MIDYYSYKHNLRRGKIQDWKQNQTWTWFKPWPPRYQCSSLPTELWSRVNSEMTYCKQFDKINVVPLQTINALSDQLPEEEQVLICDPLTRYPLWQVYWQRVPYVGLLRHWLGVTSPYSGGARELHWTTVLQKNLALKIWRAISYFKFCMSVF